MGVFYVFLIVQNGTKSRNASQIFKRSSKVNLNHTVTKVIFNTFLANVRIYTPWDEV